MSHGRLRQQVVEWTRKVRRFPRARPVAEGLVAAAARLVPKDPAQVVVHGLDESEDGALAVLAALTRRGLTPARLTNGDATSLFRSPSVRYRSKYTLGGFWSFARAGVVITSQALYGGLGAGSGQRTVLLWHGELVKPVGLLNGERALAADLAPVCSSLAQTFRMAEFGLDRDDVPIIGTPRNDRLVATERLDVRARLGWPPDEPTWLWLPTYRASVRGERRNEGEEKWHGLPYGPLDLEELDRRLAENGMKVVLKPHPLAEQSVPQRGRGSLRLLSQSDLERLGVSLYEVMAAADGLITDASSAWIDFLLVDRPLVFAFPDLARYRADRGLNLEPYEDWVPGAVVADPSELVDHLTDLARGTDPFAERRDLARKRFHVWRDGLSADRLVELLELPVPSPSPSDAASIRSALERWVRRTLRSDRR